jgi:hypothetical protein
LQNLRSWPKVLGYLLETTKIQRTAAWRKRGGWNYPHLPQRVAMYLKTFAAN